MKICRISAEWTSNPAYQFVVICGINDDDLAVKDQEWYGCAKESSGGRYPFYVDARSGLFCYGQGDISPENTDLFRDVIVAVGSTFQLRCQNENDGFYERKYRIFNIDVLGQEFT